MLLILIGKTCSGKDTVANELIRRGWHRVVTYTTRKRRRGEKDGVAYHFISKEEFQKNESSGFFLETKSYIMADGEVVYYGSPLAELSASKGKNLIILTPDGYKDFLDKVNSDHISIYIYADDGTIRKRLKNRGDSKDEAQRRIEADRKDFRGCEILVDKIVYNNDGYDLNDVVGRIIAIAEGEVKK